MTEYPDIWLDIETRSYRPVTEYGLYEHAADPEIDLLCLAYAFGDEPVKSWRSCFGGSGRFNDFDTPPDDLLDAIEDGALVWARNAAYERVVWNAIIKARGWTSWPKLRIEQMRDTAVVCAYFNLPRDLESSSGWLELSQQKSHSQAFKYLWDANLGELTEAQAGDFNRMTEYNVQDVVADRGTMGIVDRDLIPPEIWAEYAASERVNDLGMAVDRELAQAIVALKPALDADIRQQLDLITDGVVTSAHGPSARLWAQKRLAEEGITNLFHKDHPGILARAKKKQRTDGVVGYKSDVRPTFDKPKRLEVREQLLELDTAAVDDIIDVIELVDEGSQAAITKFRAMLDRTSDDNPYLGGQYVFCGAGQTHRYSSHGVQIHNLLRNTPKTLDDFLDLRDAFIEASTSDDWREIMEDEPLVVEHGITKAASMCLRPSFMAQDGCKLVWGDWSSIEARGLPWLAGSRAAEKRLNLFREGVDIYVHTARSIFSHPMDDEEDPAFAKNRQIGKVAELSLGYGGGVGAFAGMGRNYGLVMAPGDIKPIVDAWRANNGWAVTFWDQLMEAAESAVRQPGRDFAAGKVRYLFVPDLLKGTLVCELPDGNTLYYPHARIEKIARFEGEELQWGVTFLHPNYGRISIWHGQLAENVTQAICASMLRAAVLRFDIFKREHPEIRFDLIGHTHDEMILEAPDADVEFAKNQLDRIMLTRPEWGTDFPLACEVKHGERYYVGS